MDTITVEIYKSRNPLTSQPWRWRVLAANNRKLAHGGEGYTNRVDLMSAVQTLFSDRVTVRVKEPGSDKTLILRSPA